MNIKKMDCIFFIIFSLVSSSTYATQYDVPAPSESLIGNIHYGSMGSGETLTTVAKRYDVGYNSIENANPQINLKRGIPYGSSIQIPTKHLLPNQPRRGIVINLPEMRMYYFPKGSNVVYTYPIGIGKIGKTIPITSASVTRKVKDPTWTPPDDIREYNLDQGIVLPQVMPAGPNNPLGPYAVYMSIPTYLIHSTIFPESVGRRASFGCIRMYESDIKEFFPTVQKGIPVLIINSPVKVGWQNNRLYMEAHHPLEEHGDAYEASLAGMVDKISSASGSHALIDWQLISYIAQERDGIPHEVGIRIN